MHFTKFHFFFLKSISRKKKISFVYYILGRGEVIDGYYRNPAASTNPSTIYGFTLKRKNDLMPGSPSLLTSQRPSDTTKARPSFRQYNATGMYIIYG